MAVNHKYTLRLYCPAVSAIVAYGNGGDGMRKPSKGLALATAASLFLSGCAVTGPDMPPSPDGTVRTQQTQACQYDFVASAGAGAAGGALAGALLGGRRNQGQNALIGAAAGVALALLLTSYLQRRCQALAAARAQMRAAQLSVQSVKVAAPSARPEEGVAVTATDPGMFAEGSAELSGQGLHDMQLLASSFAGSDRRILIVGHTDSTGTPQTNQRLSEERARTVARLFGNAGIPAARLYYKGAGETRPVDSNDTAQGRAHNRRVDVLELQSEDGILAFDEAQDSDPSLLSRAVHKQPVLAATAPPAAAPVPVRKPETRVAAKTPPPKPIPAPKPLPAPVQQARVDFGGSAVDGNGAPLATLVGANEKPPSGFSLIPAAFAAEPANAALLGTACIADSFKARGVVKSLATGQPVGRVGDHAKGLFGKSWTDTVNGNLVGLTNVSVLRGTGQVDAPPELFVFTNYKPGDQKPSLSLKGEAQAYVGEKGLLYRVFYRDQSQPVRCMDIVFSRTGIESLYGRLYYQKEGRVFVAAFHPLAKTNP